MLTQLAYRALFNLPRFVALRSQQPAATRPCSLAAIQPQERLGPSEAEGSNP